MIVLYSFKCNFGDWKEGSVAKSSSYFFIGPRFGSQHPHSSPRHSASLVLRDLMCSQAPYMKVVHRSAFRQSIHTQRMMITDWLIRFMYLCLWGGVCACECKCPWKPKVIGSLGADVIGRCELPDMGAGNQTQDFVRAIHVLCPWFVSLAPRRIF